MKNRHTRLNELGGVAAMAALMTAAGWGVAAPTAQADVGQVTHNIAIVREHLVHPIKPGHNIFREGGPIDRFFDQFFNDDRMHRL